MKRGVPAAEELLRTIPFRKADDHAISAVSSVYSKYAFFLGQNSLKDTHALDARFRFFCVPILKVAAKIQE